VKRIEIDRSGKNGLICQDNLRADIKVVFFVRVNNLKDDVKNVASSIGCKRASSETEIENLFDAKFSEGLKTVGKRFDLIELYKERDTFKDEIIKVIGTDLNGFVLDDCAIDYLEQTPISSLDPDNILDSEGIKKIIALTSVEKMAANQYRRNEEREIKKQDVEAREAILELERQEAEAVSKQSREVAIFKARESAEAEKVQQEERLKAERARIATEEQIEIAMENKEREVLVAKRNKERTDGVEAERVLRDQELESIDRERLTTLKTIEKEKAVEIEKKNIQDVIRDRVMVEKNVVEEQQKILDTEAFALADREKRVAVTAAEKEAERDLIRKIKKAAVELKADREMYETIKFAEACKLAAEMKAEETIIASEAEQTASEKISKAKKTLAEGITAESAAPGKGEAEVILAKAEAEAKGIDVKAEAMKKFNEAGREHEEFKLELEKNKEIELAEMDVRREIAARQAEVMGAALKNANIDIVGGEVQFFEKITGAISQGKAVDRLITNSRVLTDVKETFFNGDGTFFRDQVRAWVDKFGVSSEDLKNLTISSLLAKLMVYADSETKSNMSGVLQAAKRLGIAEHKSVDVLEKITRLP
jgi:flotillin